MGGDDDTELTRYLVEIGMPAERVRDALTAGDPRSALAEFRLLGAGERLDLDALAEQSGLSVGDVLPVLEILGMATPAAGARVFAESDLRAVQLYVAGRAIFGAEATARFGRVVRLAVSRVADAAVSLFVLNVEDALLRGDASQVELTRAADEGLGAIALVPELMVAMFQREASQAVRRIAVAHGDDSTYETVTVCVGFADMVGSTVWSQQRSPRELADALGAFERLADATLDGGSRLVKMIGDEVMFMTPTPDKACQVALRLVAAAADDPRLPSLRVGLAHGRVAAIDGDLHGPVVNLAARLVHQARPGQVLADPALAAAVTDAQFVLSALAPRELAGFDEPIAPVGVSHRS